MQVTGLARKAGGGITSRHGYQDMGVMGATLATVLRSGEIYGPFQEQRGAGVIEVQ